MLLHFLFLLCFLRSSDGLTHPSDVSVLKNIRSSVRFLPSSCIDSWNFAYDPCDSLSSSVFICGFTCETSNPQRKRVTALELDSSAYSGEMPAAIGELTSLLVLDVSHNAFTGSIPSSLGNLKHLWKLDLSWNRLSGSVPHRLSMLSRIQHLDVSSNSLAGMLPGDLFWSMRSIQRLYVQNNGLSGPIPPSISQCTALVHFDATRNNLVDGSSVFSKLPPSLVYLSLRRNRFTLELTEDVLKLPRLEVLDLSGNNITGVLGPSVFLLKNIQQLNVSSNKLTSIKVPIAAAPPNQLVALDASHNDIGGRLPPALSRFPRLSSLSLSNNRLEDRIPPEYAGKPGGLPLTRLLLHANYLRGEVPKEFLEPRTSLISASFTYNCLEKCPSDVSFCRGSQRPQSECK